MIKEFLDVFPEELLGLPPEREVDLSIEVIQGTTPIYRAPYHIAPNLIKRIEDSTTGIIGQGIRLT